MFMLIGVGEQTGSGYARIQEGWKNQHWRAPRLSEQHGPDRVRLDMPMISLMPQWAFDALRDKIGSAFDRLFDGERVALASAMIEGEVTNTRMQDLVADHPSDITKILRGLVTKGLLETDNQRRWTRYSLPSSIAPRRDLFSGPESSGLSSDSSVLRGESSVLRPDSSGLPTKVRSGRLPLPRRCRRRTGNRHEAQRASRSSLRFPHGQAKETDYNAVKHSSTELSTAVPRSKR